VLSTLRHWAKRLPYPLFLPLFYAWYSVRELRLARRALRRNQIPLLRREHLVNVKSSDLLFVLGSGDSINQIGAERWRAISQHNSVGINFWPLHPFVPRMYFFESVERSDYPEAFELMLRMFEQRAADYRDTVKVAMELHRRGKQTADHLPQEFRRNLYGAYTWPAPARNAEEFRYAVARLQRQGYFSPTAKYGRLFKYAGSLTTILGLALKMQYRRVVLCGVDLRSQTYFYQDPELYQETAAVELIPRKQEYGSNVRLEWRLPATEVILELKRFLLDPEGVELYVENRSSALWPQIAEAPAELFSTN
jgi:hypothetical protein